MSSSDADNTAMDRDDQEQQAEEGSQPVASSTTASTEAPAAADASSSKQGIDIRQALEILAARSPHDYSHAATTHGSTTMTTTACQSSATEETKSMGQTIDLNAPANDAPQPSATDQAATMEQARKQLEEARKERRQEIRAELQTMSVKDLLSAVMEAQKERVATYRTYDSGLETVLQTGNMTEYPNICAQATASFSVLSDTINTISSILKETYQRNDLVKLLEQLQKEEKEKLNVTAALHLERIRERNERLLNGDDGSVARLLTEGVATLQQKAGRCIEAINEVLEEIRYAIADEDDK